MEWSAAYCTSEYSSLKNLFCFSFLDQTSTFQNHSRLRTPPLPISHSHTTNQHHAASINSLNRENYNPRSNPSPAPTDHSVPADVPLSSQEPASTQDNWLLNSNIPLETRYDNQGLHFLHSIPMEFGFSPGPNVLIMMRDPHLFQ